MKMGRFVSLLFVSFFFSAATAEEAEKPAYQPVVSPDRVWWHDEALAKNAKALTADREGLPGRYALLWMDATALQGVLSKAPSEAKRTSEAVVLTLPLPEGGFGRFEVRNSPILSAELSARFPEIQTFSARGIDDPTATARLDLTPRGFHAYVLSDSGTLVVDPMRESDGRLYMSYWKADAAGSSFACHTDDSLGAELKRLFGAKISPNNPSGDQLTTYDLAVTATGLYTDYFDAGDPVNDAMAAITTTFNRVNGIYEREVAIHLDIVAFNIYTLATDPFTDPASVDSTLLNEHQTELDAFMSGLGIPYDIGHIVTQAGGGLVTGLACTAGKARGGTGLSMPEGDVFDVDFVSHEVGHQFSASHTWTGTDGNCSPGQFVPSAAYEPGSGTTIMAYAGICGDDNVQANSDPYFHTHSFDQITAYRDGAGACGVVTSTGNVAPIIDAGPDYTIPQDTPFTLTAVAMDDQAVQVNWEQFDLGPQANEVDSTATDGPLFRSVPPSDDPSRTFPPLADILADNSPPFEVLPTVDRTMNFRATARDNEEGGGGVDWDHMVVEVSGAPFFIIYPDTGDTLECGDGDMLEWEVGGSLPLASDVRALVSDDGGTSFAELLASTANSGTAPITVPTDLTTTGRVRLEGIGNIFFDISGEYAIEDSLDPDVTAPADIAGLECASPDGTPADIGTAAVADLCDAAPVLSNDAPALFPVGTTPVIWSAIDASGNTGTDTQTVEVVDTLPPEITAPEDIVAECTSPDGTEVDLGEPEVGDQCDADPDVMNDAPALFDLGDTTVTWTATDDAGNSAMDDQLVTVQDTTAPEVSLELSPDSLWPPNHRMVTISVVAEVEDACDAAPVLRLVSIESNEPDNGTGDGNTDNDIQGAEYGTADLEFQVRAERAGNGDGRVYTVTYEAEDASGNVGTATAEIVVAHDQGG